MKRLIAIAVLCLMRRWCIWNIQRADGCSVRSAPFFFLERYPGIAWWWLCSRLRLVRRFL